MIPLARGRLVLVFVAALCLLPACSSSSPEPSGGSSAAGPTALTGSTGATPATGATSTGATGPATGPASGPTGPTETGTSSPTATDLEDGRYFGYVKDLDPAGTLRFDLAYFYSGDEANRIAAERGDETPVPNDYYIVNDNPRLRRLALAPDAEISVFDWNHCCDERVQVDMATFAQVLDSGVDGIENDGALLRGGSQYWITLRDGVVTKIEEQFLP
jgi:hypothetical protein